MVEWWNGDLGMSCCRKARCCASAEERVYAVQTISEAHLLLHCELLCCVLCGAEAGLGRSLRVALLRKEGRA